MPNLFDALPPDLEPLRASSDLVFHRLFLGRNHLLGPKLVKRFLFREETSGEVLSSRLAVHAVDFRPSRCIVEAPKALSIVSTSVFPA